MSRFFVSPENVGNSSIFIDSKEDIKHISKVLRMKPGDELDISDSEEWEYRCEIAYIAEEEIELEILDKQKFAREPDLKITLFQGIPKQGKMETIVQKSVELGVNGIVPVFMARTVVTDNGKFFKKTERWQKISNEAVKQCKRGIIPTVCEAVSFAQAKDDLKKYDLILFPYENEENRTIKDCLKEKNRSVKTGKYTGNIAIIIGPEGGFADDEATALKAIKAECVSLGKTILRTETAGPAAIAMTMYELEL